MPDSPVPPTPLPSSTPAYADRPPRRGPLVAVLGAGLVLAVGGAFVIWRLAPVPLPSPPVAEPRSSAPSQAAIDAAKSAIDKPLVEPVKPVGAPPETMAAPPAEASVGTAPTGAAMPPVAAPAPATAPAAVADVAGRPAGPTAPAARPEPPKTVRPALAPARPAAVPSAPTVAATPPAPPASATGPADRWAEMGQDLARCSRDSLIPRIACEQRVRARYCDGFWGNVPECPSGRQDHGN